MALIRTHTWCDGNCTRQHCKPNKPRTRHARIHDTTTGSHNTVKSRRQQHNDYADRSHVITQCIDDTLAAQSVFIHKELGRRSPHQRRHLALPSQMSPGKCRLSLTKLQARLFHAGGKGHILATPSNPTLEPHSLYNLPSFQLGCRPSLAQPAQLPPRGGLMPGQEHLSCGIPKLILTHYGNLHLRAHDCADNYDIGWYPTLPCV